ncbi:type II and III secretion system protein [Candidatus Magnetomorum sp. HK-1]|nr:type II and III secretion system protein [Candidatus Magnetomorum sp. HK-1]
MISFHFRHIHIIDILIISLFFQTANLCMAFELTPSVRFSPSDHVANQKLSTPPPVKMPKNNIVRIEKGHSGRIKTTAPIRRVSVADDTIADVLVITPQELYINGKSMGTTRLTVWFHSGKTLQYRVRIGHDMTTIRNTLRQMLPRENLMLNEIQDTLIISGTVSSYAALNKVKGIAIAYTGAQRLKKETEQQNILLNIIGKDKSEKKEKEAFPIYYGARDKDLDARGQVIVLVDVSSRDQVMLELCFAEVYEQALKNFNLNLHTGGKNPVGNITNGFMSTIHEGLTNLPDEDNLIEYSNSVNMFLAGTHKGAHFRAFLDILKKNGKAEILAEPTLVCASGKNGSFVAGGEFPVPVPGKDYATIEWKKYGVLLKFKPIVLSDGRIQLTVSPVVSDLDFSAAVTTGGYNVPALKTRQASTDIVLDDGQEFAIAGLFKQETVENISKFPMLGDIPILGALFRSKNFQNRQSDLVIIVRPHIIKNDHPPKPKRLEKQTEDAENVGDVQFFLNGQNSNQQRKARKTVKEWVIP